MGFRVVAVISILLSLGCRGGEGEPPCETVCFTLLPPLAIGGAGDSGRGPEDPFEEILGPSEESEEEGRHPFERDEEELEDPTVEECNAHGVTPGQCPEGTFCGRVVETSAGLARVCESPTPGEVHLVFDLDSTTAPTDTELVDVSFRFTLEGGEWPVLESGRATGHMNVRRVGQVLTRGLSMEIDEEGRYTARLEPGTYRVGLAVAAQGELPRASFRGELVVAREGEVVLDIERHRMDVEVRLGAFAQESDDQVVELELVDLARGRVVSRTVLNGESTRTGQVYVVPGRYDAVVRVSGEGSLPVGTTTVAEELALSPGDSSARFQVAPQEVSGTLSLNGQGLWGDQAGGIELVFLESGSFLLFDSEAPRARVSPGFPGTFSLPLFEGPYDVYARIRDVGATSVPRLGALVARDVRPASPLHLEVPMTRVKGRLSLNGTLMTDVGEGTVLSIQDLDTLETIEVPVAPVGLASFETLLFDEGRYEVVVRGNGDTLPETGLRLFEELSHPKDLQELNAKAHRVTVRVVVDGEEPPPVDEESLVERGRVTFRSSDVLNAVVRTRLPQQGQAVATTWLPPGRWNVGFDGGHAILGEPFGVSMNAAFVTQVEIEGPLELDLALETTNASITFLLDGEEPPEAPEGLSRGELTVGDVVHTVEIPGQGPATASWTTYSQVRGIGISCFQSFDPCEPILLDRNQQKTLASGVQF